MQFIKAAAAVAALAAARLPAASAREDPFIADLKDPPPVAESHWADGMVEEGCLNRYYQTSGTGLDPLQCNAKKRKGGKFWKTVNVNVASTCVEGRRLQLDDLHFEAFFNDFSRMDFAVYTYTGEANNTDIVGEVPTIMGDTCVAQVLTQYNEHNSTDFPNASISDVDKNDTCRDIVLADGEKLFTTIDFAEPFDIPCTDYLSEYDAMDANDNNTTRTVKLNFCSTWRTPEQDIRCNDLGPFPATFNECFCDWIDLPVTIIPAADATPTCSPNHPTQVPTDSPMPSDSPTKVPTKAPTTNPTKAPTVSPTSAPTKNPTKSPTTNPTKAPTVSPTSAPTKDPTKSPTTNPTKAPTVSPTSAPTKNPTKSPTTNPTKAPTVSPTIRPTKPPTTSSPTKSPTQSPTDSRIPPVPTASPVDPCDPEPVSDFTITSSPTEMTGEPTMAPVKPPGSTPPGASDTLTPTSAPPPSKSPGQDKDTLSPTKP